MQNKNSKFLCKHCGGDFSHKRGRCYHQFCSKRCEGLHTRRPLATRFWEKVDKTKTCWLWTGGTARWGYGSIGAGAPSYRTLVAHRVAWELQKGPIPKGHWVLHKCD